VPQEMKLMLLECVSYESLFDLRALLKAAVNFLHAMHKDSV
jgi:hypothetical protein